MEGQLLAPRILILAGDTDGNLGDLAIASAICARIRDEYADAEISLVSSRPERDRERLDILPIPRGASGLPALVRAARRADLVICGGGGLFQDDDSLAKMPYWALRLLLLRPFCRRIAGLSIGAGPLRYRISRVFARIALAMLDSVSVRDAGARTVLESLTPKPVAIVPDPAFLLEPSSKQEARRILREAGIPLDQTPLIGVAVRRWFHTSSNLVPYKYASRLGLRRRRGEAEMRTLVAALASVLDRVAVESRAHIVFMPTYDAGHENDVAVCRAIARAMQTGAHSILELDDPALYKAVCGLMSAMLCGRMHAAILASPEGTPVTALAYNPKFQGTFSLLGRSQECLSIAEFPADEQQHARLARILLDAVDRPGQFRAATDALAETTRRYIADLLADALKPAVAPQVGGSPP